MQSVAAKKTLIQCDFDGTLTHKDVSFVLLDAFADGDWRQLLEQYREDKISVNHFNTYAFAMLKADKQTLLEFMRGKVAIRPGFHELLAYCQRRDFHFVIVSNGLDFYIEALLGDVGASDVKVFAAETQFTPECLKVQYVGPQGNKLDRGFKEAYIRLFLGEGYRVVYVGNGASDVPSAKLAHHIFATGELLDYCQEANLQHTPFDDLHDIIRGLESL